MRGIIIDINPIIFKFGSLEIRWYSLAILVAVISAIFITAKLAKRKGIQEDEIYSLAIWVIAAGVIGARLFHVIDLWGYYSQHPGQIFQMQQGGLAIWGALLCGLVTGAIYARIKHIPVWKLFDSVAPALLVAQIIGRFGCIVNGDAYGSIANLPWAFIYTHPNALIPANLFGVPTHPYPVYEQIWNAMTLLLIWRLAPRFKRDGMVFLTYLSFYSVARFLLTFVREEKIWFWGLQEAQVIAIATLAAALVTMIFINLKRPATELAGEH